MISFLKERYSKMKTIGVLTSGGDSQGMNAAVRAVVRTALNEGFRVMGINKGYNGLINGDITELNYTSVSNTLSSGGTFLKTARCLEFKEEAGILKAVETCKKFGIDGIVVLGGDGIFQRSQRSDASRGALRGDARHDRQRHRMQRLYNRL